MAGGFVFRSVARTESLRILCYWQKDMERHAALHNRYFATRS